MSKVTLRGGSYRLSDFCVPSSIWVHIRPKPVLSAWHLGVKEWESLTDNKRPPPVLPGSTSIQWNQGKEDSLSFKVLHWTFYPWMGLIGFSARILSEKARYTDIYLTKIAKFSFSTEILLQGLLPKALKERKFEWPQGLQKILKFILASWCFWVKILSNLLVITCSFH